MHVFPKHVYSKPNKENSYSFPYLLYVNFQNYSERLRRLNKVLKRSRNIQHSTKISTCLIWQLQPIQRTTAIFHLISSFYSQKETTKTSKICYTRPLIKPRRSFPCFIILALNPLMASFFAFFLHLFCFESTHYISYTHPSVVIHPLIK